MAATKFSWTVQSTKLLISEYKAHEELHNTLHNDYKDRNKRLQIINAIAETISVKFGPCNVQDVKKKINGLRSQYLAEKLKITKSIKSGAEGDSLYKPLIYWFPLLEFLNASTNADASFSNLDDTLNDNSSGDSSRATPDDIPHPTVNQTSTLSPPSDSTSQQFKRPSSVNLDGAKKKKMNPDNLLLQASKTMTAMSKLVNRSQREDSFDIFGKFIASELRSMDATCRNDLFIRKAKRNIQSIIIEMWNEIDGDISMTDGSTSSSSDIGLQANVSVSPTYYTTDKSQPN